VKRAIICLTLFTVLSFYFTQGVQADDLSDLKAEIQALKTKVTELESRLAQQEGKTIEVEKVAHGAQKEFHEFIKYKPSEGVEIPAAGLEIGADATLVFQGTPNANNTGDDEDSIFDASWKVSIEIGKEFDDWGFAFIELEAGQNDSVESELSVFSNVDAAQADSDGRVDITKVFYEHYPFKRQLILTIGKIDAGDYIDVNSFAGSDKTQFLGNMFKHAPTIEYPSGNNLGVRLFTCFESIKFVQLELGCFDGNGDWDDIFDHNVYMGQINLKPTILLNMDKEQRDGNYRFYTWINDQYHTKLVNAGEPESEDTKEMNYGFGLSCDQMITDVFGVFGRFGWQRPDIVLIDGSATIETSWSTGAQMTGKYWMREDDILGFAIGQVFVSEQWEDSSDDNYGAGEGHIEAYYKCQLNQNLAISPDMQVIWNPNGVNNSSEGGDDTIFIYGLRGHVDF